MWSVRASNRHGAAALNGHRSISRAFLIKGVVDITARIASIESGAIVRIQRKSLAEATWQIWICNEKAAKCYKVGIAFFEYRFSFRRIKSARCNNSARKEFA